MQASLFTANLTTSTTKPLMTRNVQAKSSQMSTQRFSAVPKAMAGQRNQGYTSAMMMSSSSRIGGGSMKF